MHVMIAEQIELAKRSEHPRLICCLGSSWLFMGRYQFLPGYCVLAADPIVESLNALPDVDRGHFLHDMGTVGALLKVTRA